MMKRNDGFTLVELIVSIAISTVITGGVLSILLFGMRINAKTADNVKQQNAVNMLTQIVQSVAEESNIVVDETNNTIQNDDGFTLKFENYAIWLNRTEFMTDVQSFEPVINPETKLLTVTIKVGNSMEKATTYTISSYCRLYKTTETGGSSDESQS